MRWHRNFVHHSENERITQKSNAGIVQDEYNIYERRAKTMVYKVSITNFRQVQKFVSAAQTCKEEVGVHDANGSIADARSILGMMSLDYSRPIKIVCESETTLNSCLNAIN